MTMIAMALPILPGKTDSWTDFMNELSGPRLAEFHESRRRLGVRERTFLQRTPMGDFVLVTLEGEDPAAAFAAFGEADDAFTNWFVEQVVELHGVNLREPMPGPLPDLVIDSSAGSPAIDLTESTEAATTGAGTGTQGQSDGARVTADCRLTPSESNCTLTISGEADEVVRAASIHAVDVHGHQAGPELEASIASILVPDRTSTLTAHS